VMHLRMEHSGREMPLRLINSAEVRKLLPTDRCIGLMRRAMAIVADGGAQQPIRSVVKHPSGRGKLGMMPGYVVEPECLGIKVTTVYPNNCSAGIASHQGVLILFNPQNGVPIAIMDGGEITAIRTAAASAVATDVLANKNVSTLAIFGYGEQAKSHIDALVKVRKFQRIVVWGRDLRKAEEFCIERAEKLNLRIEPVASARVAVGLGDVLCTTTGADEPFIMGEWLKAGQHLNVVGSSIPSTSEIDAAAVARARFFVDFRDSALALAGDFLRAKKAGVVDDTHIIGSIGEVLTGRCVGRTSRDDITLFKSLGMSAEDLLSADYIFAEAIRQGVGVSIDW
jgi:ornithine cyclodeaminase/alanine dehydrogenase-like protein (mu-crystallin family)